MSSLEGSYSSTMFMCVYYICIGSVTALANVLNLSVYSWTADMRRRYLYFIAYEVGGLINSLSFVVTGIGRMNTLLNGTISMPITAYTCFYERYWVHLLILGTEVPTLVLILISLERICAVTRPALYTRLFDGRSKKTMLVITLLVAVLSLCLAALSAYGNNIIVFSGHCPIISSTSIEYSTSHFVFLILGYSLAFLSLLIMKWRVQKYAKKGMRRKNDATTNILIAFTGTSIALVALPGIVMIGIRWSLFVLDDVFVALSYSATAMVAIANTVINFRLREDFHSTVMRLFNNKKMYV